VFVLCLLSAIWVVVVDSVALFLVVCILYCCLFGGFVGYLYLLLFLCYLIIVSLVLVYSGCFVCLFDVVVCLLIWVWVILFD